MRNFSSSLLHLVIRGWLLPYSLAESSSSIMSRSCSFLFLNCLNFWFAIDVTTEFLNWELFLFPLACGFIPQCCSSFLPLTKIPWYFQSWLFRNPEWLCPDEHVTSSLTLPPPVVSSIFCKLELNYCLCWFGLLGHFHFLTLMCQVFAPHDLHNWERMLLETAERALQSFLTKPVLLVWAYVEQNTCLQRNRCRSSCLLQNGIWEGLFEPKLVFAQVSPC